MAGSSAGPRPRPSREARLKRRASSSRASAGSNSQRSRAVRMTPSSRSSSASAGRTTSAGASRLSASASAAGAAASPAGTRRSRDRRPPAPAAPLPRVPAAHADRDQVVVPAAREPALLQQRARRDRLDHLAPDDPLGQLRVLDLLADGHAEPGAHQLPQVLGGRLDRHAGERDAVAAAGERDAQQLGGALGVVEEHLVEVAHAEEQDRVLVPRLDVAVLQHERRVERIGHGRVLGHQHEGAAAELRLDAGRPRNRRRPARRAPSPAPCRGCRSPGPRCRSGPSP